MVRISAMGRRPRWQQQLGDKYLAAANCGYLGARGMNSDSRQACSVRRSQTAAGRHNFERLISTAFHGGPGGDDQVDEYFICTDCVGQVAQRPLAMPTRTAKQAVVAPCGRD